MKNLLTVLVFATSLNVLAARNIAQSADYIASSQMGNREPKDVTISPARIKKVDSLVSKSFGKNLRNLEVRVVTTQTGGATDVSPQLNLYFGIYSENEMFDAIANYNIGSAYKLTSVTRVSGGVYKLKGIFSDEGFGKKEQTITVNAVKAINELETLKCPEFDVCKLKSAIEIKGL